jgi:hypothetical protein
MAQWRWRRDKVSASQHLTKILGWKPLWLWKNGDGENKLKPKDPGFVPQPGNLWQIKKKRKCRHH